MGFVNLIFLAGAAAVAGPILAHLLLRSRPKRHELPTLRFLQPKAPQSYSRHRLKNLLLLAVRTLIILILVFAFARPYLQSDRIEAADLADVGAVIAIDTSLSMGADERWDAAKEKARQLADLLPQDSPVALVAFDRHAEVALSETREPAELSAALDQLAPGYATADYTAAARVAMDTAATLPARLKRVYVVSDFQATGVPSAAIPVATNDYLQLEATPIATENVANWAISGAIAAEPEESGRRNIQVLVSSYGSETQSAKVELYRATERVDAATAIIEPGASAALNFELNGPRDEDWQLDVRLDMGGALLADDTYFFISEGIRPIPVTVVERTGVVTASADSGPPPDANPYLAAALRACEGLVTPQWIPPERIDTADSRIFVVPNGDVMNEALTDVISQRVHDGAALVIFPGQRLDESIAALAGVTVETIERTDPDRYNLVTSTSGPIASIDRAGGALLGHPRAFQRFRLTAIEDQDAQAIAALDDGSAYLVERRLGDGVVYLFATGLDTAATDLVLRSSFAPFLFELMVHGAAQTAPKRGYAIGESIAGDTFAATPGLFSSPRGPFAVNVDRNESDLRPAPPERIAGLFVQDTDAATEDAQRLDRPANDAPDDANKVWRYLAGAALALMMAEMFLASRTLR